MTNEIEIVDNKKERMVLSIRNGRDIPLGSDPLRIKTIETFLSNKENNKGFISIEGEVVSHADIVGMFKESTLKDSQGSITFINSPEGLHDHKAKYFEWTVASKSGASREISSEEYYELLEFMKKNKSGKVFLGGTTFDVFDITSISEKSKYEKARLIKQGWWECREGNLHPRDEKYCDESVCRYRKMQEDKKENERLAKITEELNKEKV